MAQIRTLMQGDTQVLPRTVAEAVSTDAGSNVQAELDALRGDLENVDVSKQINAHNVAEDAHANRFANYLPLSGGTMTGELVIGNEKNILGTLVNTISFSKAPNASLAATSDEDMGEAIAIGIGDAGQSSLNITNNAISIFSADVQLRSSYTPTKVSSVVNKKYVDDQIAAIPTPDVSGQIETHNTSTSAHANMGWITAEDEMLSNINPDGAIDAATLEGHPASYFATKDDLSSIDVSDQLANYVLKSELSTLVPQPDLTNYYTKAQVDEKITQIQNLINQAAALVDEINGEVI